MALDVHYQRQAGKPLIVDDYLQRFPDIDRLWLERTLAGPSSQSASSLSLSASLSQGGSGSRSRLKPVLPGFEVLELLGRGGMGVVYKARQIDLNRLVAIKMILAGEFASPEAISRFRAEARAVAQLQHPNLVQIFDVGEFKGRLYLTFEYIPGGSLDRRLRGVPQLPKPSVRLIRELARATQFAHTRSIVHRDLKPANVLLVDEAPQVPVSDITRTGSIQQPVAAVREQTPLSGNLTTDFGDPKIADFGLAKKLGDQQSDTQTGAILGSPSYMAPEQAGGDPDRVGPPADIYALGAILYEMLTGRPPFRSTTIADTLDQVRHSEPISPRRLQPSIPRDLETICLKCLEKEPAKRYESAGALADDLDRYLRDEPVLARPVSALERSYRWCRRHPLVALLATLLVAVTLVGTAGMTSLWLDASQQRDLADESNRKLRIERDAADEQRSVAEINRAAAERSSYFHQIGQAWGEFQANQIGRAVQRLDECAPELRGWEWRYLNMLCRNELMILSGHQDEVFCVRASPDGNTIVSGSGAFGDTIPGEVIVWDGRTGAIRRRIKEFRGPIVDIAWSHDGSRFVTGSSSFQSGVAGGVIVWTAEGQELFRVPSPGDDAYSVALSPDGKLLAVGNFHASITLWDVDSRELKATLKGHGLNIFDLAFSPDGRTLASVCQDGSARTWDVATAKPSTLSLKGLGTLRKVAFSPDGRSLAMTNYGSELYIQDLTTPDEPPRHIICNCKPISGIAYSPEGRRLVVTSYDGQLLVYNALTGREIGFMPTHNGAVNSVCFDNNARLITGGMDRLVKVWDSWTDGKGTELNFFQVSRRGSIAQVAVTPDGQRLLMANAANPTATNSGTNELLIWNLVHRKMEPPLKGHTRSLTGVAVSADSAWYATSSEDGSTRVWNAATGECVHDLRGHTGAVCTVSFSGDGSLVASAGSDGVILVWEGVSGKLVHTLDRRGPGIRRIAFAPRGTQIAAGNDQGDLTVWNLGRGEPVIQSHHHEGAINSIAYSHSGEFIATAGDDHLIHIANTQTGNRLQTLRGHTAAVRDLTFTPDDRRLASVGNDHLVKLWDPTCGEETFTFTNPDKVSTIACHPDGERFYTCHRYAVSIYSATPLTTEAENRATYNTVNLDWHRDQARECLKTKQTFAAQFHCDQWAAIDPTSVELESMRSQLEALEQELAAATASSDTPAPPASGVPSTR